MKMDDLTVTEESNEIRIDVQENSEQVDPSTKDAKRSKEIIGLSLESSLQEELSKLPNKEYFHENFIFKVSEKYRKAKEEFYTPRVVSIGPLHHGKSHLQAMEIYKLRCLNKLIIELKISLKELSEFATGKEGLIRTCYQDFKYNAQEFSKMILLDGIFIILVIAKGTERFGKVAELLLDQNSWMESDVKHDMLLLENQLPLFFVTDLLEHLYLQQNECSDSILKGLEESFFDGLQKYFSDVGITNRLKNVDHCNSWHLVDYLLDLHGQSTEQEVTRNAISEDTTDNNSELQKSGVCLRLVSLRKLLRLHLPSNKEKVTSTQQVKLLNARSEYTRSSSELHKAGVRFCPNNKGGLSGVSFDPKTGELCIPHLRVNDMTETFFRNLIAFEQCQYVDKFITSYIIFMDNLINTAEDVELLVKRDVIDNLLGENQLVADLFNNLHKEIIKDGRDFYFTQTCNELNKYSKDCFHQWRSSCFKWRLILKNNYFSNPWSVISFIAATIVVVLTIVQTVCAIAGLKL